MNTIRTIFIGGPGRSGTSFVADCLGNHAEIAAFRDVELKIFSEKGGLIDLHHSLCDRYSPNRGTVAITQFQRLTDALTQGHFGQTAFKAVADEDEWRRIFERFVNGLKAKGMASRLSDQEFYRTARSLVQDLGRLADAADASCLDARYFLEKTPHALLAVDFLDAISPGGHFVHVMRDPRSIASSLQAMRWAPNDLEACCTWVSEYCRAWLETEIRAAELGLRIEKLAIEDIAADPRNAAKSLCATLGIAPDPEIFDRASLDVLNGWAAGKGEQHKALLDDRLAGWVHHFGYSSEEVGQRAATTAFAIKPVQSTREKVDAPKSTLTATGTAVVDLPGDPSLDGREDNAYQTDAGGIDRSPAEKSTSGSDVISEPV